jgi:uncharacterized SAM-binding protein YcdF (DUF218 family)
MDIFLSKFLPIFVYPVGLSVLFLLLVLGLWKKKKAALILLVAAIVILWVGGNRWVALSLTRSLEIQYPTLSSVPHAPAMVVLGGGTEPMESPRTTVEINGAGDRVLYAWRLYKDGEASHIVLSGGDIAFQDTSGSSPATEMEGLLLELGVPQEALWLDATSVNTYQNAINSKQILSERGIHQFILVTSAMHMPRAMILFKGEGWDIFPAPTDTQVTDAAWNSLWHGDFLQVIINIFPSASNLSMTTNALKEYIGMAVYFLMGK